MSTTRARRSRPRSPQQAPRSPLPTTRTFTRRLRHLITVGIPFIRRLSELRHSADETFVEMPARPDEGSVVEARGPERRREIEHAPEIEAPSCERARPQVLPVSSTSVARAELGRSMLQSRAARTHSFLRCRSSRHPLGRRNLKLRETVRTPLARSADASESPSYPS